MAYRCQREYKKWCTVPQCPNTSDKTPDKIFIPFPKDVTLRTKWLTLAGRNPNEFKQHSRAFCCEDHFIIEKEMANYYRYKMGFSQVIKMVSGVLPSKFHHQNGSSTIVASVTNNCVKQEVEDEPASNGVIGVQTAADKYTKKFRKDSVSADQISNESSSLSLKFTKHTKLKKIKKELLKNLGDIDYNNQYELLEIRKERVCNPYESEGDINVTVSVETPEYSIRKLKTKLVHTKCDSYILGL